MSSENDRSWLRERATAPQNVATYTAIAVALPASGTFYSLTDAEQGGILLLIAVVLGVPEVFAQDTPDDSHHWKTVGRAVLLSLLVVATFFGLYLAGRNLLSLSRLWASVPAFVGAFLGPTVVSAVQQRL